MRHYYDTVANANNQLVPGASVAVFFTGTTTPAPLFSDDGLTPLANPVITDAQGRFNFTVADGVYDLQVSGGNIQTTTQTRVEIADITDAAVTDSNWQTQVLGFLNQTVNPTPPAGLVNLYSKSLDKNLYFQDDTGREVQIGAAGATVTMDSIADGDFFTKTSIFQGPIPQIYNGDFESTNPAQINNVIDGWFPNPDITATLDTVNPYEGAQSLKTVSDNNPAGAGVTGQLLFPVTPGEVYAVRGAIRTDGIVTGTIGLTFLDLTQTGLPHTTDVAVSSMSSNWVFQSAIGVVPPGAVTAGLILYTLPFGAVGTVWYDAIEVFRITAPLGLLPGPVSFANLGPTTNGVIRYCPDCAATSPCIGGGGGAIATGLGGVWNCGSSGGNSVLLFNGPPTGTCTAAQTAVDTTTGNFYSCVAGAWIKVGPGGNPGVLSNPVTTPNPLQLDVDVAFKGPDPWVDIRRYGARSTATNVAPMIPGITASINSGAAVALISSASSFQNGDGVTIFGAGQANGMSTPAAPVVGPAIAKAMTGTGIVATGPNGTTTYNYQIVARNKAGGLTAASPVGTTTVGQASLGFQSVAITSIAKSGNVNTVTTATPHGLSGSCMVRVFQTSDDISFGGYFVVISTPDSNHFTYQNNYDTTQGGNPSATGGLAQWFNCNHVTWTAVANAWTYYIYGRTGGSLTYLGMAKPGLLSWDDFGSPMMDNVVSPYFVPSSPSATALNNPLVTTIVSGAGTTSLTLANIAGNTVNSSPILFDNTPALQAAAQAVFSGGTFYIPVGTFVTNSYCTIPGLTAVNQAGNLFLNDTMDVGSGTRWFGQLTPQRASPNSFAFEGFQSITAGKAPLAIYAANGGVFRGFALIAAQNGIGMLVNGANQSTWESMTFTSSGSGANDYMSQGLVGIGVTDTFFNTMNNITLLGAQNVNSLTPLLYFDCSGAIKIRNLSMSGRGLHFGSVSNLEIENGRIQGGNGPFLALGGKAAGPPPAGCPGGTNAVAVGPVSIRNFELDTMAGPLVSNLFWTGTAPVNGALSIDNAGYPSFNGAGLFPNAGGTPFYSVQAKGNAGAVGNTRVTYMSTGFSAIGSNTGFFSSGSGNVGVGFSMQAPPAPTVTISGAGTKPAGTWVYYIFAADAFPNGGGGGTGIGNGYSPISFPSAPITVNGSQGVLVSFTPIPGQTLTTICASLNGSAIACPDVGTGHLFGGTSILDTGNISYSASANGTGTNGMSSGATNLGLETYNLVLTGGKFSVVNPLTFATLGTPPSGTFGYCADCTIANPCVGGGTGAFAKRLNNIWVCN